MAPSLDWQHYDTSESTSGLEFTLVVSWVFVRCGGIWRNTTNQFQHQVVDQYHYHDELKRSINSTHTFVAKVFADFRFESLLQSLQRLSTKVCKYFRPFESMGLLPPKSEKTFQTFGAKVFADFRGKSLQTLEVITPYFQRGESMAKIWSIKYGHRQ